MFIDINILGLSFADVDINIHPIDLNIVD